jgi:predicted alpha/beta-fold hydrolase
MKTFLKSDHILRRIGITDFRPLPLLKSGFRQTVAGAYWPQQYDPGSAQLLRVDLGEGDATLVAVDSPIGWKPGGRIALLVHGLSGDHLSTYMVRHVQKLTAQGFLCVRMNLRNAGAAFGLSRKTYHAGITGDIRTLSRWIGLQYPHSAITAVGFSLGGNLLLKTASEDGPDTPFRKIIAVSPAVDLASSSRKLERSPGSWISRIFLRQMIKDIESLQVLYPDLERLKLPRKMSIREFDEIHISKFHGFLGADDYYSRCSSGPHLPKITVPTLIIGAIDDPVVDLSLLQSLELPEHIDVVLTKHGGHVGFVAAGPERRWADAVALAWIK